MNGRRIALVLGVLTFVFGIAAVGLPGLLPFAVDRIVVVLIGALALLQAVREMQRYWRSELDEASPAIPERGAYIPAPGANFDETLSQFVPSNRFTYYRVGLRQGLRAAAVSALVQFGSYSEEEASEAVADGSWTEDLYASAFLGGEGAPEPPLREQLRDVLRRRTLHASYLPRTVREIARLTDVSAPDVLNSRVEDADDRDPVSIDDPQDRPLHGTGHWTGVSVVALVGIGIGVITETAAVLLAGIVGVGFVAYARTSLWPPGDFSVERTLSDLDPEPGDSVTVTLRIHNESGRFQPDIRVVDGVPEMLVVPEDTASVATSLRPGQATSFTYRVTARRGRHHFGPVHVISRDLSGSQEQEQFIPIETTLVCIPALRPLTVPVPMRQQAMQYVGQVETTTGGEGLEFFATREYRPSDALSRIDWNRRARTGDFTTIEFREERAATVMLLIDARDTSYVTPQTDEPHALDRAVDAAGTLFSSICDAGDRVGIAAVGSDDCWLPPGSGADHRLRARELLGTHPELSPSRKESQRSLIRWRNAMRARLESSTQLYFFSPLVDDYASRIARRFEEYGYPVTVISPDPGADRTTGHILAQVARRTRIADLRSKGIPVIDWARDESVDVAIARHRERWSR